MDNLEHLPDYQRMVSGQLYNPGKEEAVRELANKGRLAMEAYNQTSRNQKEERQQIIREIFASTGENFHIEAPFHVDYGAHISIGENFYANFDCIFLDVAPIRIGHNVMFGPRVSLLTPTHPLDPQVRIRGLEYGLPITIGDNCWLGGNVVVNPGVTIGDNTIIGSGSVVTKNMPANVIAAGNPCRVIRQITEGDRQYWEELESDYYNEEI